MATVNSKGNATTTNDEEKGSKKLRREKLALLKARNADPFADQRDALIDMSNQLDALSLDGDLTSANRKAALEFAEALYAVDDDGTVSGIVADHCEAPEDDDASADDE